MTLTRRDINDMMQAYKKTSLLRTGVELGVFDALAAGPATASGLAPKLGIHPRGARILLDALTAIRLTDRTGEHFSLTPAAADHLVSTRPDYLGGMVKVMSSDWESGRAARPQRRRTGRRHRARRARRDPGVHLLGGLRRVRHEGRPADRRGDGRALAPWTKERAELDILDVACGHGVYGYTLAQHNPQAAVTSLDWPTTRVTEKTPSGSAYAPGVVPAG